MIERQARHLEVQGSNPGPGLNIPLEIYNLLMPAFAVKRGPNGKCENVGTSTHTYILHIFIYTLMEHCFKNSMCSVVYDKMCANNENVSL